MARDPDTGKWTVMVFMGADNPPGQADLTQAAESDIQEMRDALGAGTGRPHRSLEIVYQLYGKTGVTRQHLGVDPDPLPAPPSARNATDGSGLLDFIGWALKKAKHEPSDHAMLVLWGHTERFAIGAQTVKGVADALDFGELATVLKRIDSGTQVEEYRQAFGGSLDIIAFDSCDASTIEMAVQLSPFARYLLSTQVGMPLPGFPYTRILERLADPRDD